MVIKQVNTVKDKQKFLRVSRIINHIDPFWIKHFNHDIEAVFDPAKNNLFKDGEACRWIMENAKGKLIGRVAAFINKKTAYTHEYPTGGIGFFECINDKDAAFALFDKCRVWLLERGMKAMEGPINFGDKDRFWGLMVHNAGYKPPYLMNYNPTYYKELFEAYGFQNFYEQYIYRIHRNTSFPEIFTSKYKRLLNSPGYTFETPNLNQLDKYALDFMTIYNEAWKTTHKHFKPLSKEDILKLFHSMKKIIDPEIIVYVYYNERPIAFFVSIPELNQIFQYLGGKLNLLGKIKFLYHKWKGTCRTMYGLVFGIVPEFRGKGIDAAMVMKVKDAVDTKNNYDDIIITWIGDFNPKMIRLIEAMNFEKIFTLVTYKKLFNPDLKFKRHPDLI